MNKHKCIALFAGCFVAGLHADAAITDFFFHRGRYRDRLVWYLSHAQAPVIKRAVVGAKQQVTITIPHVRVPDAKVAERLTATRYRHGVHVSCTFKRNTVQCTVTYRPSRVLVQVRELTNIRGAPMISVSVQRTDAPKKRVPGICTIVIDAGHGGSQIGGQGGGIKEKQSTLRIAKLVRTYLQNKGYRVIMTRTTDKHVPLDERTSLANKADASVFVSIHHDVDPRDALKRGVHVIYSNDDSAPLAHTMHQYLTQLRFDGVSVADEGIARNYPQVTYGPEMPAVLAEVLFLSNSDDAAILRNRANAPIIAQALADAINAYCIKESFG